MLGPGRHADRDVAPEMQEAADTKLVAVWSRDRERGERFAAKHNFQRAYDSFEEMLKDPEVDAVYDSTPDGLHVANIAKAARAGKHMLVEKPLGITIEQCRESIEICQQSGVKLGVVFQERHQPAHMEAKRLVAAGEIGDVMLARVQLAWAVPGGRSDQRQDINWRTDPSMRPGGAVMGSGDHCYDTLLFITNEEVLEVVAFTDSDGEKVPNERTALAMMKLKGGGYGYIFSSRSTPYAQEDIVVHGTKGTIVCANTFRTMSQDLTGQPRLDIVGPEGITTREFDEGKCYKKEEVETFNRCIEGRGDPMTTGQDGLVNAAITEAIYESARSKAVIPLSGYIPGL